MSEDAERKCIGVLVARPDKEYQTDILCGIYKAAFERDMNVAVFSTSSNSKEIEIFSLPDYDRLAGVIYLPYTFDFEYADEAVLPRLIEAVKEKNFPVVTLDRKIEGLPCVMCDDSDTVGEVLEHLINDHECRDIAYLTGSEGHMHAESRLKVYRKVMKEHGLPILPGRERYGDFWFNSGYSFVESLINSENGLPDAIVCANSTMACSVYRALQDKGIGVPEDILVAQYSDSSLLYPFITGAVKQVEPAGYNACAMLADIINGRKGKDLTVRCGCKMIKSITCGCMAPSEYDFSEAKKVADGYYSEYNLIVTDLLVRKDYRELFWGIDWYTCYIKNIDAIYFCMRDGWDKPDLEADGKTTSGFPDRMHMYYYRENYPDSTHKTFYENSIFFDTRDMLPELFKKEGEPSSFIFRPLTFGDMSFGYVAVKNGTKMKTVAESFNTWVRDISNAIESQRRLQNMKYLFTSDLMTGIFNRNGFNNMMPEMINEAVNRGQQLFVALFDLNGMKFINDTYGHIEGDNSIKTAAEIISSCRLNGSCDEKNFRIGGDEFVKAAYGQFSESDIASFRKDIERRISEYNSTSEKAYPIYISTGICIKEPDDDYTLDTVIYEADKEMFRDKARIRQATGFNPKRNI